MTWYSDPAKRLRTASVGASKCAGHRLVFSRKSDLVWFGSTLTGRLAQRIVNPQVKGASGRRPSQTSARH